MRTTDDLEKMIRHQAVVRISRKIGRGDATISAWPAKKSIYINPDWLDESKTTDAEVKDCLYHELGHRKDWVFTTITLIASTGLVLTVVAVLWNAAISIWGNVAHQAYPAHIDWILYGLGVMVAGVLTRWALYDYLERRAERLKRVSGL